jgi:hypothetical protein
MVRLTHLKIDSLEAGRKILGQIEVVNLGRSPARNVIVNMWLTFDITNTKEETMAQAERTFQLAMHNKSKPLIQITLAQNDRKSVNTAAVFPGLTAAQIRDFASGQGQIILAGQIDYWDANNFPHATEVCFMFTGRTFSDGLSCGLRSDMR